VLSVLLSFSFGHCVDNGQKKKTEEQTTQWTKEKDNTMNKRKRQKNRQHNGQKKKTTQWTKEKHRRTDKTMVIVLSVLLSFLLSIVLSVLLSFSFVHCVVFFFWPLGCLSFCLFLLSIVLSVLLSFSFGHCVVCSSVFLDRRTDNPMAKRKRQRNGQKKKTEEQTTQWTKEKDRRTDNTMTKRKRQKNRQHNGQKLYVCFVDRCWSFCTFSFGHCVVCSSLIYGF
jgi:Zn-finger nucleic acid-binding protein